MTMNESGSLIGSYTCMHSPQGILREGLGVALLEVSPEMGFEVSKAHAKTCLSFLSVTVLPNPCPWLLPRDQDTKLSAAVPVLCLSVSCHDGHGLTL